MKIQRFPFSILLTLLGLAVFVFLATILNTNGLGNYGIATFITTPFLAGVMSTVVRNYRQQCSFKESLASGLAVLGISYAILFVTAFEGAICLLMSAPIAVVLQILGSTVAFYTLKRIRKPKVRVWVILLLLPLHGAFEPYLASGQKELVSSTTASIEAPPKRVWQQLVGYNQFAEPASALMKAGISYPVATQWIPATTDNAPYLQCEYSNGSIALLIDSLVPEQLLQFRVEETPATMKEMSFYDDVHAPHLHGNFHLVHGRIILKAMPNGTTEITTTSTYTHRIKPAAYWKLWSDFAFDQVHDLVISHLKNTTER